MTPSNPRLVSCALLALLPLAHVFAQAPAAERPAGPGAPTNLRVEYRVDPIGIDEPTPRFSWEVVDARRGSAQGAYRILVAEDVDALAREAGTTWDSGRVPVPTTNQVEYAGGTLVPWREYVWTVRTWDLADQPSPWAPPARFTMGPMRPSDWTAKWIGAEGDDAAPPGGWRGYKSRPTANENDFEYVQFDFGTEMTFDNVVIHPARPAGSPTGKGELFPLRVRVYVDGTPAFDKKFMKAAEYVWQDLPDAGAEPLKLDLNSRFKIRCVRVIVEKMQRDPAGGYAFAVGEIEVRDGAYNVAPKAQVTVGSSLEGDGWSARALTDGELYPGQPKRLDPLPAVLLRRVVTVDAVPRRAWLAASALGLYEIRVNGRRVGDDALAPGWTDYHARAPYRMYDVTKDLVVGQNVIAVTLGDGWYAGRLGLSNQVADPKDRAHYGRHPRFLAQLRLDDGTSSGRTVVTDETWQASPSGPIRSADLFDGVVVDQHDEPRGWERNDFDAAGWRPVAVVDPRVQLVGQVAPNVRALAPIPAVSMREVRPGAAVYDFGQNVSGVVRLAIPAGPRTTIQMRHAEIVDARGMLDVANLRTARQTDTFVVRDGFAGTIEAPFTSHGFRYVEISGRAPALPVTSVWAVPYSADAPEVGAFECSSDLLNRVWSNAQWSRRANFAAVPTDCPQRDERLGWTGDVLTFAPTALYQADLASYLTSWLRELRGAQSEDGRFPDFAPNPWSSEPRWRGTPGWGDAGVFVPWQIYLHYHDRRLLKASVDSMIRWCDHVQSKNPTLVWKDDRGSDYGDWLNGSTFELPGWTKAGNDVPRDVFASAFFARSCELAAKAAFASDRPQDAERMAATARLARRAFRQAFVDPAGVIVGDTQGGYALALDFGLLDEDPELEARAVNHLVRTIEKAGGALTTGFHTTHRALLALSSHGRHDVAMRTMLRTDPPSFGAQLAAGATTTWERMDGFVTGRGPANPAMNSFNHVAFGSVGEWLMRAVAGLDLPDDHSSSGTVTLFPIPDGPTLSSAEGRRAFEHVRLKPMIGAGVTWAKATHASIAGTFAVSWRIDGATLVYDCTIPANSSATLELPATSVTGVTESGQPLDKALGVVARPLVGGRLPMDLGAGTYHFTSRLE